MTPSERSEAATAILDDLGFISGSAAITSNAVLFFEDMQKRLKLCRERNTEFYCSEKQLEWLEHIKEAA
jgi:hypothetical protein